MVSKIFKVIGVSDHCFESTSEGDIPYTVVQFKPSIQELPGGIGVDAFSGNSELSVVMSQTLFDNLGSRVDKTNKKIDDAKITIQNESDVRYEQGFLLRGNTIIGVLENTPLEQEGAGLVIDLSKIPEVEE